MKCVPDMFSENHKMLLREIGEQLHKWKDVSYGSIQRLNYY